MYTITIEDQDLDKIKIRNKIELFEYHKETLEAYMNYFNVEMAVAKIPLSLKLEILTETSELKNEYPLLLKLRDFVKPLNRIDRDLWQSIFPKPAKYLTYTLKEMFHSHQKYLKGQRQKKQSCKCQNCICFENQQ